MMCNLSKTTLSLRLSETIKGLDSQHNYAESHRRDLKNCEDAIARLKAEEKDLRYALGILGETK